MTYSNGIMTVEDKTRYELAAEHSYLRLEINLIAAFRTAQDFNEYCEENQTSPDSYTLKDSQAMFNLGYPLQDLITAIEAIQ